MEDGNLMYSLSSMFVSLVALVQYESLPSRRVCEFSLLMTKDPRLCECIVLKVY